MALESFMTHCATCGTVFTRSGCGTGYGIDAISRLRHCYACCAERDREKLARGDARGVALYLASGQVTTWTGLLRADVVRVTESRGNRLSGYRADVRFSIAGRHWYGRLCSRDTQILSAVRECKRSYSGPRILRGPIRGPIRGGSRILLVSADTRDAG